MSHTEPAVHALIGIIDTGDMDHARSWAARHVDALFMLRSDVSARTAVAHACNRWGARMVWPWGDRPVLTSADQRVLVALRARRGWRASEDTVARLLAFGLITFEDGGWHVV